MPTATSHISCVLRCSGISLVHAGTISNRAIFIYTFSPEQRLNLMDRKIPYNSFVSLHQHITSTIFLYLFSCLLVCTLVKLFFNLCFLGPPLLIAFVSLNKFIIIVILIIITPYFYLLMRYKPVRNIF